MNRFDNTTVLITGAAGGQGSSHASAFAAEGANVVVTDIRDDEGRKVADELGAHGHFLHLDVTDKTEWAAAVEAAEDRFGPIGVLVNNAGVLSPSALIEHGDLDDWHHVLDVNLTGQYLGIGAVAPSMRRNGTGAIVNIASTAGHVGTPFISAYVASKWGVRGLARSAALELARDNIRVNVVAPGVVDTPLITEPLRAGEVPISDHYSAEPFAIKRLAQPEEITRLVLFLASHDADFVTGSEYVVDGGLLLGPSLPAGQDVA